MLQRYGIIYKATNLINSKVYIGQTTGPLFKRKSTHIKNKNKKGFSQAIEKYGKEQFIFEEIYVAFDKQELDRSEEYFISFYDSTNKNKGYNLIALATYSTKGYKHSPESIKRMVEGRKGKPRNPYSEETKRKMSEMRKGKPTGRKVVFSEKTKIQISETLKNKHINDLEYRERVCAHLKNPSSQTREKMRLSKLNKKQSQEHKENISKSLKGKRKTKEHGKNISKSKTGMKYNWKNKFCWNDHPEKKKAVADKKRKYKTKEDRNIFYNNLRKNKRNEIKEAFYKKVKVVSIKCLTTNEEFKTYSEAAKKLNINMCSLREHIQGLYSQVGGYKFEAIHKMENEIL